jgi:hypothetical protein
MVPYPKILPEECVTFPRLVLLAAALIGQSGAALAQGAFPAPLPGQAAAPAGAPPPMSAAPSPGSSFPSPSAGGFSSPSAAGPGGFGAPPQQAGPPGAGQQCQTEFNALKNDASAKAAAISGASKRKATPAEACKLFGSFVQAEAKMISYVVTNTQKCGIPPNAADQMKKSHAKTVEVQGKVCAAAQNSANQQPAAPSLSEALGSSSLPESKATKRSGGSTFDTLNGNVLAR